MSTTKELKEYLINKGDGFLLNPDNNSKTIMLSGAWGAGKTHFWLNEISPRLKEKQTNIYVSLYGKKSIDEIKFDILKEAYNSQVKENFISKSASLLSTIAPSFGEKSLTDGFEKLNKEAKGKKATEILQSGSVICLDDFERKSKKVDLNDLFGFISQLAIDMHCKMVIILNSDVFEGEEANVFRNVKEKTVNKFFYFEPTIEELFYSISNDEKYNPLDNYKEEILKAIEETEELNARIYIQVLDNCLEWMKKIDDNSVFRVLVLSTVCFIKNHFLLSYPNIRMHRNSNYYDFNYKEIQNYVYPIRSAFPTEYNTNPNDMELSEFKNNSELEILKNIKNNIGSKNNNKQNVYSDPQQLEYLKWVSENNNLIKEINKYGYRLHVSMGIDEDMYEKIVFYIKTGILP